MSGWNWLWMGFGAIFWIVFLGGVVYLAVRIALSYGRRP
jgi:hypothetical protein